MTYAEMNVELDQTAQYALIAIESATDAGIPYFDAQMCYETLGPDAEGPIPELSTSDYKRYCSWFDFIMDHAHRRRRYCPES